MGVSADQFIDYSLGNIVEREVSPLGRELGMEHNLGQKIAKFFAEFGLVSSFDGFDNLVRFFDQVRNQSLVSLFSVPCAPFGGAKDFEEKNQALHRGEGGVIDFVTKFRHSKLTFRQELADQYSRSRHRGVCLTRGAAMGIMAG
jgi:hypothetical protein